MHVDLYSTVTLEYLKAAAFVILLLEFLYSFLKKDGIYSIVGTFNNILRGLGLLVITLWIDDYYFGGIFVKYAQSSSFAVSVSIWPTILCFVVLDLFFYLAHMLKHHVGFLWALHAVHHNDQNFNMSTYMRASWVERVLITSLPLLGVFFLGFNVWDIAFASAASFVYQFFCHSQYIRFPKIFEYVFITPNLHRIHHDQREKNQYANFGTVLSLWDRLFGTYIPAIETFTPGIKGYHQDDFIKMETDPIKEYLKSTYK